MPKKMREIFTRRALKNYLFIAFGCFCIAFSDAVFITPFNLVPGGIISIGILVQYAFTASGSTFQVVDIVTWIMQLLLLLVAFLFVGKRFALRTLFASIAYPLFFSLLYRIPMVGGQTIGIYLSNLLIQTTSEGTMTFAVLILAGLFGGGLIGLGVAFSYWGNGSSGGLDVISVLLARHTPIKEGASSFLMDAILVLAGIFCSQNLASGLVGILSAFICALVVQYVYVNASSFVIADIISEKWREIQEYVIRHMDRTTTILQAVGGYSKQPKTLLRVAFSKRDLQSFRDFIGRADPKAFVTFTTASMINGEGFDPLVSPKEESPLIKEPLGKKTNERK